MEAQAEGGRGGRRGGRGTDANAGQQGAGVTKRRVPGNRRPAGPGGR